MEEHGKQPKGEGELKIVGGCGIGKSFPDWATRRDQRDAWLQRRDEAHDRLTRLIKDAATECENGNYLAAAGMALEAGSQFREEMINLASEMPA